MTENNDNLRIIAGSEIEPKEVNWLWYPYIPYGKITIVQGDPGEGEESCRNCTAVPANGYRNS